MCVDRRNERKGTTGELIQRPIRGETEPAARACAGVAYERSSRRGEIDGVQQATGTKRVRGDPIEHASAWLEAQVTDTERRSVVVDHAYGGDQAAGIWIDLDQRAGIATR